MLSDNPEQRDIRADLHVAFFPVHLERDHGYLLRQGLAQGFTISDYAEIGSIWNGVGTVF
jgi:hypothetical protein